jgi:hypothetical protein
VIADGEKQVEAQLLPSDFWYGFVSKSKAAATLIASSLIVLIGTLL